MSRRVGVAALEGVVTQEHAFVGAHREHLLDGGLGAFLPEGDDGDLAVAGLLLDAEGGFSGLRVEGAEHGRDALCRACLL